MTAFDSSIPINPASYDAHSHVKNRISFDVARSVGIAVACERCEAHRQQLVALAHLPAEEFLYALRFQKLREER